MSVDVATPAVILAGGQSRRMGVADKTLLPLGRTSVLSHVIAALEPQTSKIMINANGDPERFSAFGLPVCADIMPGFLGPLAGIHTAMVWAQTRGHEYVFTVPGDAPCLPHDLLTRLGALKRYGRAVTLLHENHIHPTVGLWPTRLATRLHDDMQSGARSVYRWLNSVGVIELYYPKTVRPIILTLNTPQEVTQAKILLRGSSERR